MSSTTSCTYFAASSKLRPRRDHYSWFWAFADKFANDTIKSVQNIPRFTRCALALAVLMAEVSCGSFFPGSNTITALQVTPASATIPPGTTQQYTATATFGDRTTGDVTSQVNWSTSPTSVATIASGGLLTGVSLGIATVRAQSGGVIATTPVTISQKQITSIAIQPLTQTLSLSLGPTTIQFTATATYKDGTTGDVTSIATWSSAPSSTASISSTGLATAAAVGTATVTATSGGVTSNSATITVIQ